METETQIILNSNSKKLYKNTKSLKYIKILLFISILIIFALFIAGIFFVISIKNELSQKILNLENSPKNDEILKKQEELKNKQEEILKKHEELKNKQDETLKKYEELKEPNYKFIQLFNKVSLTNNLVQNFSQILYDKYIEEQKYFCYYEKIINNDEYEKEINIANVDFKNKKFDMYVYKESDDLSKSIITSKNGESEDTNKILDTLKFYKDKNKTKSEDLYILDIGSSIGWYSYFLGKKGYKILSFEPSERNYYLLRKTYCLNKDVNITIINKALYNHDKSCDYYENKENKRKGKVICKERNDIPKNLEKKELVTLTQLDNYASYLSDKNIAFMKITVGGAEYNVILGGKEFITKIHVPFIYLEFITDNLNFYQVDKSKFLRIFEENGYKISTTSFLDKNYISVNDLINKKDNLGKLFIVYEKILKN